MTFGEEDFRNVEIFKEEEEHNRSFIPPYFLPVLMANLLLMLAAYLLI